MKKFTAILLTVIMVASLFISCNNSIAPNVTDETVSVSFSEATSRSLAASLEEFKKGDYYWKYAAKKNTADGTGLNSGETANYGQEGEERVWINGVDENENRIKGLGSVAGFSQGIWDFKLFAYKLVGTNYNLAYQGEVTGVSLKKGSANTVTVTVSPVAGDTGTLILSDDIKLKKADNSFYEGTALTKVYTVTELGGTAVISPDEGKTNLWTLDAGAYKVNVDFVKDGFTYASGSVVATVYSNITTTVSGDLAELVTKAEFDSSINPDVMNKVASTDAGIEYTYEKLTSLGESAPVVTEVALAEETGIINAIVPGKAAANIIKTSTGSSQKAGDKVELRLKVDTTAATSSSLSLEISMEAAVTYAVTDGSGVEQKITQINKLTDESNNPVISIVTIQLQTGLQDVMVSHSGIPMEDYDSSSNGEGYKYNDLTGVLTIKTSSFSPFEVTYKAPEYPVKIGDVKYASLQAAVNAVGSEATTIDVIGNMSVKQAVEISGKPDITINLNNTEITGINTRVLWVKDGKVTITGTGTISATDGIDAGSSVIRVSDKVANSKNAEVIIGSNVTVASKASYGITVFGKNTGKLTVDGTVKTVNAPAISGNGSADLASTTITINGTVVSTNNNAIYHPQAGNLTITGKVIGYGGIEAKAGTTTVSVSGDAWIEATSDVVNSKENNNGCSTSGYAIAAVNNNNYKGNATVTISGGTVVGKMAVISDNPLEDEAKSASITVKGGKFTDDPVGFYSIIYKAEYDGSYYNVGKIRENTSSEPIKINNEADWLIVADSAYTSSGTQGLYYSVLSDLDFTGVTQKAGFRYFAGYIDFNGHSISGLNGNNTYTYRYPSLFTIVKAGATIKNLKFELPNLGTDYTVKPIGAIEGTGTVTLENIAISGNLNMTDNNTGLLVDFIGGNYAFKGTVNIIGCTSTCNMVNSGYASAFIGGIYYGGNNITLNVKDCVNYGKILSTGSAASMLISNPTRHTGDTLSLTIEDCRNEGQILAAPGKNSNLVMPDAGTENKFFAQDEIKAFETSGAIVNANEGFASSLIAGKLSVTSDGKFDLIKAMDKETDATRFELTFGFQGTGGLGAGGVTQYSFSFDSRNSVVNVPAYKWVNASNASGKITAHNEYGTTYYTDGENHYVYNQPGYTMNNQPEVSFVAYDADGNVILVDFYSYSGK